MRLLRRMRLLRQMRAARDPPTTRAGGHDDGNYTKLPQTTELSQNDIRIDPRITPELIPE